MEVRTGDQLMSTSFWSTAASTTDMVCHISASGYLFWFYGIVLWIMTAVVFVSGARNILRYRIEEEVAAGTRIGDILRDSHLKQTYATSPDVFRQLRFGFLAESDLSFSIGAISGVLQTSGRLDRESIPGCPGTDICEVTLDVAVQPVQYFQIIKVTIEILDINDNAPVFPDREITHPILESALQGSSFVIPTATDLDSPLYGVDRYELDSDDDTFGITQKEKLDGAFDLRLTVQKPLDREIQDRYRVTITALDGGNPANKGHMTIVIPVMDSNDNSPVFDNSTYRVTIPESISVGVSILRVHATDQDLGQNGRILYGFSPMTQGLYGNILAVNQETGDIYVSGKLDRERVSVCNLIVTATDQGPDSLPSDTTVVVTITDVNDNAPQITINTLGSNKPGRAQISEDAQIGTFVAHVSVTDPDLGLNGRLNCSLNDYTFNLRQTFDTEYQIVTARPLDRETIPQYGLEIVCRDKGQPPQVAIKRLAVELQDVNDNSPVFSQKSYTANMVENNFVGIGVIQTVATDRDIGRNGDITYTLSYDASETFEIDPHTGAIKTRTSIDRERTPQYHFQVIATDHGIPPRSAMAHVVVNVEDINDEIPEFVSPSFTFYVGENEPERTEVGKVTAVDRDAPPYNQFMYAFVSRGSSALPFMLDTRTGRITTRRPLDREKQNNYRLIVRATDQGSPPMSSTASITILVSDKNDNAPKFEFPSPKNNSVFISNKVPVGSTVAQISAHDADDGNNAKVTFHVQAGNEKGMFSLNPESGVVSVNVPLNELEYATFELGVQAKDHGTPQLRSSANLRIVVNSSIPYPPGKLARTGSIFHYNVIVVVAVACGGAVITVSLIVGIILVRNQGRKRRVHKYNCRMEAKKMLSSKELQSAAPEESIPIKNGPQADGGLEISRSLSQMENHPQISGLTPGIPLVQLHPKPWCTASSALHREHPGRGPGRANPVHGYPEQDKSSDHSGDGSLTDSGKGPSEEGEMKHRLPHSLGGHYGTHGHVKLPNTRREGHYVSQAGARTLPLRTSSESYPPPPPPPNRLRTFSPDGQIERSPNQSPSSVVYPSGMEPYAKPSKPLATKQQQDALTLRHGAGAEPSNDASSKSSDPWHRQGAVIGESVIV